MGTEIELHLDSGPADETLRAAEQEFRRLERLLSRFLPDSQLSRLNAEGRIVAGPDLFAVVEAALEARERTAGRFDPTVHEAVVAAGYDRTFELVSSGTCASLPADVECGGAVALDRTTCSIMLAPGVKLDLGGIAKGYAVDRALGMLAGAGAAVVDAGGDIGVSGKPWPIGV
jgi:thiamine biosynthesis lipoprotein